MKLKTVEVKWFTKNVLKRQKTWSELLLEEVKQFCLNTALHGYRFTVLPKRILLERVFWGLVCLLSVILAIICLCIAWLAFKENPIESLTASTQHPVYNYEFPAVTVCNNNKISKRKAFLLARKLTVTNGRNTEDLAEDIRLLFYMINKDTRETPKENYIRLNRLLQDNHINVDDALRFVVPSCDEILLRCKWKGEEKECEGIFEQVRTSQGFCCSFNYYALKKHSFSGFFASKAPKHPRRVSGCGYQTGLEVVLDNKPEDYFATDIPSIGFRVFIHNAHYYLDNNSQHMLIGRKTVNFIEVTPHVTYSTDDLRKLHPAIRHCLFSNERTLANFKQYTFHNCMVECKINMTMRFCGCLPSKYLLSKVNNRRVCTPEDLSCLAEYEHLIESSIPGENFSLSKSYMHYRQENNECSCFADCNIMDYLAACSSGELNRRYSTNELTMYGGLHIDNQSVIRVYFSDLAFNALRWNVISKWHTLLAYYGGLLGLFLGFSFVSVVEIVYFFVVRFLSNAFKNGKFGRKLTKCCRKHHPRTVVKPTEYRLNPGIVIIPSDKEITKYKRNSYFFN